MRGDLNDVLRQLDTLMSQRAVKDEAVTLIVEALHRLSDKISGPGLKTDSPPTAGSAPQEIK
jgi:hypothetical protein